MENAETFWRMEVHVVPHAPVHFGARSQPLIRSGMPVFNKGGEGLRRNVAGQSEAFRRPSVPSADDLLPLRIVVLAAQALSIILPGCGCALMSHHAQHCAMLPQIRTRSQRIHDGPDGRIACMPSCLQSCLRVFSVTSLVSWELAVILYYTPVGWRTSLRSDVPASGETRRHSCERVGLPEREKDRIQTSLLSSA